MNHIRRISKNICNYFDGSLKWFRICKVGVVLLFTGLLLISSCDNEITGEAYYTFKGETVGEYIANRPESYSEFTKMLEISGVMGLLNAYGEYTCFVPDNDAMFELYKIMGRSSLDEIPADTVKKIVFDHIIKDFIITSDEFVDGFIPELTMSGRYIKISFETIEEKLVYKVNTTSTIIQKDIEVHNGVIHALGEALLPTENSLVEAIAANNKYSLFYEALIETELYKLLEPVKDETYFIPGTLYEDWEGTVNQIGGINHVPKEKKYGFTAFMESDSTYDYYDIHDLDDLKALAKTLYDDIYPQDAGITDVTDRKNSLNRFIAYHLINKKLSSKLLIEKYDNTGQNYASTGYTHSVKSVDMFEYLETMCPNTLLEVRTLRVSNEYNVLNMIESGDAIRLTADFDNDAINGVYHEIDGILAYTSEVDRMLSSKRLRMDAASFFPELTNNNIRTGHATTQYVDEQWIFPPDYIERVKTSTSTTLRYINADDRFCDYQGDEVFLTGMYDFEITTPPIPAGTYEVRFGYQPTANRGAAQLFWDGQPTGIPLDLRLTATDPKIGYIVPDLNDPTDPYGYENDKMMRNRGYMKAPACFKAINTTWYTDAGESARMSQFAIRRILGIYTFTEAGTHVFKVSAVRSGEFMFDYLEFVPTEVLEYEDIY